MKTINTVPNILEVSHDEEDGCIVLSWKSFNISLPEIKAMHAEVLDYAAAKGCPVYVADTSSTVSRLPDDVIAWWRKTWIPVMREKGIRLIVTVLPKAIVPQFSTFEWQDGDYGEIRMSNAISWQDALKIVREFHAGYAVLDPGAKKGAAPVGSP